MKPYGFMRFLPGPGVGGHCIPCDPHYLLWQLKERRVAAPMITQAMTSISERPTRVVDRARQVLSDRGLGLGGARVLVVGVAYKPDVADLRESPALEILAQLAENGATDVRFTLTREQPAGWRGYRRRIDKELLADIAWPPTQRPLVYICGPTNFVETAATALVTLGHEPGRVRLERFGGTGGSA